MANITDGNYLVWNQGLAPLVGYNFMLRVELLFDLPCKSVKAFTREMEYELIQEGGLNDYVHMRRKPISKPFYLEIERYVGVDYVDPLPVGAQLALPVILFVSRYQGQFIPGIVARTYIFTGCNVTKKVFGELNAERSGLMTETTTISYNEMLCIDLPWSSAESLNFASGPKSPQTNAKTSSTEQPDSEGAGEESQDGSGPEEVNPAEETADDAGGETGQGEVLEAPSIVEGPGAEPGAAT